jgi:diacylglycerol kinase (CTP)
MRDNLTWSWDAGISNTFSGGSAEGGKVFSGWVGFAIVTICAGLFSGVAEALGGYVLFDALLCLLTLECRFGFRGR